MVFLKLVLKFRIFKSADSVVNDYILLDFIAKWGSLNTFFMIDLESLN